MTFLEGLISFISPCMLPMLPIYISYFGGKSEKKQNIFFRVLCFETGFTAVFCLLGLFAGSFGAFLVSYRTAVNIICGITVIFFGLSYLEIIRIPFFKGMKSGPKITGLFSAFIFGIVYSVSLTPCVGAFLGSALMTASVSASAFDGTLLLLTYSSGLAIPFMISAMLLDKLGNVFVFIKNHYRIINTLCGIFLIITGILMATGLFGFFLNIFNRR